MIEAQEIKDLAGKLSLDPRIIEKDYVIGWVLAGIYNHPLLSNVWIFKGGTCVKKCFVDTQRMSEDLDFTLTTHEQIDVDFLKFVFSEDAAISYGVYGLPPDRRNLKPISQFLGSNLPPVILTIYRLFQDDCT